MAIFLFTRQVLAFFRVNPAKSFNQPNIFYPERLFLSVVGSASGKSGETRMGGVHKNQKIGEFSFRGILQPTTATHPGVGGGTHRRRATFDRCSVRGGEGGVRVWSFVVLFLSCRVFCFCCSCCVFVCVTCFSSHGNKETQP